MQYTGGWSEHTAPDGRPYFYNSMTGVSQWERPAELAQPAQAPPAQAPPAQAQFGTSSPMTSSAMTGNYQYGVNPQQMMHSAYNSSPAQASGMRGHPQMGMPQPGPGGPSPMQGMPAPGGMGQNSSFGPTGTSGPMNPRPHMAGRGGAPTGGANGMPGNMGNAAGPNAGNMSGGMGGSGGLPNPGSISSAAAAAIAAGNLAAMRARGMGGMGPGAPGPGGMQKGMPGGMPGGGMPGGGMPGGGMPGGGMPGGGMPGGGMPGGGMPAGGMGPGGMMGHPAQQGGFGRPIVGPGPPIQHTSEAHGPPGSNLFIFHIPNDMTNRDLFNLFTPFGNVISARIMVDRDTGRSRGFGFVSYDDPTVANKAVASMDGYQVGRKRLKVQFKQERDGAGPGGNMQFGQFGAGVSSPMTSGPIA